VIALPVLMFIYPITIVLILLNVLPKRLASSLVFKAVILTTFVFSLPDVFSFIVAPEQLEGIKSLIPLSEYHMAWVLPAIIVFVLVNGFQKISTKS